MRKILLIAAALAAPIPAQAAPELGPAYGDGMVLQRGQPVILEGKTRPGETVTATLGAQTATSNADDEGKFRIKLPALAASTSPVSLTLRDRTGESSLKDLLIGDVYLCSGQSNMELPVNRALDTYNQLRLAPDGQIRLLKIPKSTASIPQENFSEPVGWQAATSESVADFSAACFYMGKEFRRRDKAVPIGLIHSNWGGSAARAWLTPEGVSHLYGEAALGQLRKYSHDPFGATQEFVPAWYEWWRSEDNGREPWTDSSSLQWQPIPKFSFWNEWTGSGLDENPRANVWLKQTVQLSAEQAANDATLSIGAIDDLDLTFVNGKPVGYTFGWGVERTYHVPGGYLHEGENEILIAANNMWDTGGFYGGADRLFITPGNGQPAIPIDPDWLYSLSEVVTVPPRAPWDANAGLGVMHNSMIAPLGVMKLAGVAWYQGESDVGQPGYDEKLKQLFVGWRGQFGDQARIVVVQLANFGELTFAPAESGWAELRQEQLAAVQADQNAALVTAIDIGEPTDIHPANKNDLGKRLAAAFLDLPIPMPKEAKRSGDSVIVTFTGITDRLIAYGGGTVLGVELCGSANGSCHWVTPSVAGDRLVIPIVGQQAADRVRYAWSDAPIVNLYDASGLPVPGFELEVQR